MERVEPVTVEQLRARTGRAPDPQPRLIRCVRCRAVLALERAAESSVCGGCVDAYARDCD